MKSNLRVVRIVIAIGVCLPLLGLRATSAPQSQKTGSETTRALEVVPVQGFDNTMVYMIAGAGANIAFQVGDEGVVLVDSGPRERAPEVLAAIRKITNKRIIHLINTHAHEDHVGGNEYIVKATGGQRTSQGGGGGGTENPGGVQIYAHQKTADRMLFPSGTDPKYPDEAVAKFTFLTRDKQLYFNGEAIELWWQPNAHTEGDVIVFFRKSDVIVAGDLYSPSRFPVFELNSEGSLQGILNGLNQIVSLAVPAFNQTGGTRIIPGHGWLSTQSDVVEVRDMATVMRDRIRYLAREKRMTLAQVKALRPAVDYDPVYGTPAYGADTGFWTTDQFVEAVYADMSRDGPLPPSRSGLNFSDGGR